MIFRTAVSFSGILRVRFPSHFSVRFSSLFSAAAHRLSPPAAFASGYAKILKIGCLCLHNNYTFLSRSKHNAVRHVSRPPLYIRPNSAFIGKITLHFVFYRLKTITNCAAALLYIIHKDK